MKLAILLLCLLFTCSYLFASESLIFKDDLDGAAAGKAHGVSFVNGKTGQAAHLDTRGDSIEYPADKFAVNAGRIEFDFSFPNAIPADREAWELLSDVGAGSSHWGAINVGFRDKNDRLEFGIFDGSTHHWCYSKTDKWEPGRWYHVSLSYGSAGMSVEIDGRLEGTNEYPGGLARTAKKVGWDDPWWHTPPVMVDNFKTYRINSDSLDVSPNVICPYPDRLLDMCEITYGLEKPSVVTMEVVNSKGKTISKLVDRKRLSAGEYRVELGKEPLPEGDYTVIYTAERKGGNVEMTGKVRVDNRWKWKEVAPAFNDFFPLAMYYFWEDDASYINRHIDDPQKARDYYERTIKDLADHGINMIITAWTPKDHQPMLLDIAEKYGVKVIANLDDINFYITSGDAGRNKNPFDIAANAVKPMKDKPALAGYYIIDEPGNSPEIAERIRLAKQVLETVDPKHPSFSCLLGGYENLLKTVDYQVLLIDIYPIGIGWNGDFSGYISQVKRGYNNAAGKKPLWVITQVFGKPNAWKIPTPEEIRAQVWLALAHGANGVHYFIYQSTTGFQGEWLQGLVDMDLKQMDGRWDEIKRINGELKTLAPTLLKIRPVDTQASSGQGSLVSKDFADNSGKRFRMIVNQDTKNNLQVDLSSIKAKDVLTGEVVANSVVLQPGDGKLLMLE